MFRRLRTRKWLVAGLGVAALVAPTSALAGNHNMSSQAYRALVAKGQALNERYGGSHNMSRSAYNALVQTGQAENQRYAAFAQGQAMNDRYGGQSYGPVDSWYPYAVSVTQQSGPVLDGRSPDTVDAAIASQADRLAPVDGRSPDTVDAAIASQNGRLSPIDGRSPDTVDFAVQAHNPFVVSSSQPGFQWGDFGVGGGVALGAVIILLLSLLGLRSARQEHTPVAGT
jgi:hypothetical protein